MLILKIILKIKKTFTIVTTIPKKVMIPFGFLRSSIGHEALVFTPMHPFAKLTPGLAAYSKGWREHLWVNMHNYSHVVD
jgi:hypothetical protein